MVPDTSIATTANTGWGFVRIVYNGDSVTMSTSIVSFDSRPYASRYASRPYASRYASRYDERERMRGCSDLARHAAAIGAGVPPISLALSTRPRFSGKQRRPVRSRRRLRTWERARARHHEGMKIYIEEDA